MPSTSFEEEYFQNIYGGNYILRNPPYKWRSFLRQILAYKNHGRLLDIGCGFGLFLEQAANYFEAAGCDISAYALEQGRKNLPEKVVLFQAPLGNIETSEGYDVVTCFDVLEHIPNLDRGWENLEGLLRPDGILALTVPVYDGPFGWLVNRLDRDESHVYRKGRDFWLSQVQRYFKLLAYKGIWRYFLLNRYYINYVSDTMRKMTTAIMLIVQKSSQP